jgi:hypothetical protein
MSHFIVYCRVCNKVISQCRCMFCDKEKKYGVCPECLSKEYRVPKVERASDMADNFKKLYGGGA